MKEKFLLSLLFFLAIPQISFAFDPPVYFEKNCSSCHTVGGGDGVGPDLMGVAERRSREWLIPFIRSSQTVMQSGDPVAVELFNKYKQIKMPDQEVSPDEVVALLDYIAAGGPAEAPIEGKPAAGATEAEIAKGRDLFIGRIRLAKGGPACIACHSAGEAGFLGGGTLGINLTQAYSKYEDKGLTKALKKPGFRIMKEIYAERPLQDDEAFALKAFLYQADKAGIPGRDERKKFLFLGLGGTVLMLGVTDLIWRKRRKKSTKPWAQ